MYVEKLVFDVSSALQTVSSTFPHEGHFSESPKMSRKGNNGVCVCGQIGADTDTIIYLHTTFHLLDLRFTILYHH